MKQKYTHDKMVSVEPQAHGLTEVVPSITFENSTLNWDVDKRDIFMPVDGGSKKIEGYSAICRKDLDLVLQVPRTSYEIIQNARVFEAIENSLIGLNHSIIVSGSLQNCKKIFVQIAIEGKQDYVVNGDQFKNYLCFFSSHDGQISLEIKDLSMRLRCSNAFMRMHRATGGKVNLKIAHTKNAELRIKDMEKVLEEMFIKRDEFYTSLTYLASRPFSLTEANKLLTGFCGNGEEMSTKATNQVEKMLGLFQHGTGNKGETLMDIFNATTEYYTFNGEDKMKTFVSNQLGSAANKKQEMYDILMSDSELERLAKLGEKLLNATKPEVVTVA